MSKMRGWMVRTRRDWFRQLRMAMALATVTVGGMFLFDSGRRSASAAVAAQDRTDQATTAADAAVQDPRWGEPLDGLQFRLRTERTIWESWQQPIVVLEVRNATDGAIPAAELQQRLPPSVGTGLTLMRQPSPGMSEAELHRLEVPVRADADVVPELKSGDIFRLPLAIRSTSPRSDGLSADQIVVGLGRKLPWVEPQFFSNLVPLRILPAGVRSARELDAHLKRYDAAGQPVDAGFVPDGTTRVDGQQIMLTFVVRNPGQQNFTYAFGGDYRGAARHNRFRIEVRDAAGILLPDPAGEFGDFGGILMPRTLEPNRLTADTLDLQKYRRFTGPGRYSVSAQFDLANEFGTDAGQFTIPVEARFDLTILPRTAESVAGVLERQFARCTATSGPPLQELIDTICEFGQDAAVPGLARLAVTGTTERRRAAIRGLGTIPLGASLAKLLEVERDPQVREAALLALGTFRDDRAVQRAVEALSDPDERFRTAAAAALGRMKSDAAVRALLDRFDSASSLDETAAILAALGDSGSREAFTTVAASLSRKEEGVRRAAVSAIVRFAASDAEAALRPYTADQDLDFRETVIRTLAETLRVPIDGTLLAPVIRSRRGTHTIGDAPRLLRLYTDDQAAPILLSCLDFDDPSIRSYYNMTIIQNQLACRTGLAIPWIGDLNRDGTLEELQRNRKTLAQLKAWTDHYQQQPWSELEPGRLPAEQEEQSWGPEVAGVRVRARLNCSVWPQGLPQVITLDAIGDGGSIAFPQRPEIVELEVNGHWYAHDPEADMTVCGDWNAYKGHSQHSFQLTPHWKRIADAQPLDLAPGKYTARMRVVPPPAQDRRRMVTSRPLEFRVLGSSG